jgi:hypothetical protein
MELAGFPSPVPFGREELQADSIYTFTHQMAVNDSRLGLEVTLK